MRTTASKPPSLCDEEVDADSFGWSEDDEAVSTSTSSRKYSWLIVAPEMNV